MRVGVLLNIVFNRVLIAFLFITACFSIGGCAVEKDWKLAEEQRIANRDNRIAQIKEDRALRLSLNSAEYINHTDEQYIEAGKQYILNETRKAEFQNIVIRNVEGLRYLCGQVRSKGLFGGYGEFAPFVWINGDLHMRKTVGSLGESLDYINALNGCRDQ